ncbi:hypothetical protein [Rhizomonospora bruguierae]|uniref:hypothetical protein n=1 Tax=Rhizomonospora bruguierae TaxID=1581705 RepID=UPI001BCF00FE|nr:hypothetical protein [Micromonospora sp. NBRC 107566]
MATAPSAGDLGGAELIAAPGGADATNGADAKPAIIYSGGRIDGNVDHANNSLSCADYVDPAYSRVAFLPAPAPDLSADAGWAPAPRTGPVLPALLVPIVAGLLADPNRLPA